MTRAPKRSRVIVVAKQTAYERFVEEQDSARAKALLEQKDPTVARWKTAHEDHRRTLEQVERCLVELGADIRRIVGPVSQFDARDAALIVTVGGDGTLLDASHHVDDTPILGINSSPDNSVGFFCAGSADDKLRDLIKLAFEQALPSVKLARMKITINGQIRSRRVLNEALFCHVIPAATSRYIIAIVEPGPIKNGSRAKAAGGRVLKEEEQRSSGIWVGTAAGSTAAIRSAGGRVLPFASKRLELVVREPYVALGPPYELSRVVLMEDQAVRVRNKMEHAGVFVDGPFESYAVGLGDVIEFAVSDQPLTVLGLRPRRSIVDVQELITR